MNDPRWSAGRTINVVIADQQYIFLEGLKKVLGNMTGFQFNILATVHQAPTLVETLSRYPADVLLLDPQSIGASGPAQIAKIRRRYPALKLLVLTADNSEKLANRMLTAGAQGVFLKNRTGEEFAAALAKVLAGQTFVDHGLSDEPQVPAGVDIRLTRREKEILGLITQGLNNKAIGNKLFISDQTVSVHRKNIMRKLSVNNTATLVRMALEYQLV